MIAKNTCQIVDVPQGSAEWLEMRRTKITATDAAIILGQNPWRSVNQLYDQKTAGYEINCTAAMQRGKDLEPIARQLFEIQLGVKVEPQVVVSDNNWQMASLDGIDCHGKLVVEIKCPGPEVHKQALAGCIPSYYVAQLQHQMCVCNVDRIHYFSFDGFNGVDIVFYRDDKYIKNMTDLEREFYECLINKVAPDDGFANRDDPLWSTCAAKYRDVQWQIDELKKTEDNLKNQLIQMANGQNCRGSGLTVRQIERKGNVDYAQIPELKNVDLEKYRKEGVKFWSLTAK